MASTLGTFFKLKNRAVSVRLIIIALAVIGIALMLSLWWYQSYQAKAASTNRITIYTALLPEQLDSYLEIFHAQHPSIRYRIVSGGTVEITDRLIEEKDNPQADVVWGLAATSLLLFEWNNMLMPYAPVGLERVDPKFRDTDPAPMWVGQDVWMSAFCVNQEALKERRLDPPTSWEDLAKTDYKGQIVFPNPLTSGTGYMSVVAILQHYGESTGWTLLDQIHENVVAYVDVENACQMVSNGDIPIAVSYDLATLTEINNGHPITITIPTEGAGWDMEATGLIKKYPINPAAEIFLDWAITDSAMREYRKNYLITSVHLPGIALPESFPGEPTDLLHDKDLPWAAANHVRVIQKWTEHYTDKVHED